MLAYLSWHRAAAGVDPGAYEQALERFHRSLAHQPPSGFRGSAALRLGELPWLAPVDGADEGAAGYEDWYLLEDWNAVGVLEEAAPGRGHETAHRRIASLAGAATGAVYRLVEGSARPSAAGSEALGGGEAVGSGGALGAGEAVGVRAAIWVEHRPGRERPSLGALLGDGIDPARDALWRRCIGLGPAPEYCLLAAEPPAGVAGGRLPSGWVAQGVTREVLWSG
ncbi:MAG TPA: hypothetical protein VK761_06900 [Solirubrobacteraceae bacterium]|nr:hypothetical protein [Solirubrobacteraceae bacterium]